MSHASAPRIRVLCVDDHDFVHAGIRTRVELERDMEFVGHAATADELSDRVEETSADIVLLDIEMPGADPFLAIEELRVRHPDTRVVVLSAYVRDRYIDMAIDGGAWGYFSKSDTPDAVIAGIRRVAAGHAAFGPEVRQRMEAPRVPVPESRPATAASSRLADLSARELEVLRLIGRGMARAEIAQHLHRSVKTIDAHHTSIMKKLDLHDRVELALFAVREGLVEG